MASVYIETSIPSYYHESRTSAEAITWRRATRRWWDDYRESFSVCTSELTLEELRRAPQAKSEPGLRMLSSLPMLERDDAVVRAAQYYLDHRLVPRSAVADAVHLALASRHGIDYVLTWNIRHLANPNKSRHLAVLNGRLGLSVPILITPLTLLPEDNT